MDRQRGLDSAALIEQSAQPKRWLKTLSLSAALVAGACLLRLTVFRPVAIPVTVHLVEVGRVEHTVVNSRAGTVQSRRRAGMSPGLAGLVSEKAVEKGSQVKRGDVLLRLDDSEHKAQVQLSLRSLEAAKAVAEQARLDAEYAQQVWKRTQILARDDVLSATAQDQDRNRALGSAAAALAAQARIREAEASLDLARATLAKTVVTAPFDGVVLDITTEVGEWISPSPPGVFIPPVVDLIDARALYVSAPIDEADVARIAVGLPVRMTLDAFRGQSFAGTVTYVSSFVETRQEQNRTLRVEAEFKDSTLPPNLLPGLSADVEVLLEAREQVLRIPTYALLEGNRVLVVEAGRLVEKKVATGLHNWNSTEVTSGLAAGERVVVSLDRPEVKAGARVVIAGEVEK